MNLTIDAAFSTEQPVKTIEKSVALIRSANSGEDIYPPPDIPK
jgi:hypothetical protein